MIERQGSSIVMELMDGDLVDVMRQRLEKSNDCPPFSMWEAIDIIHQIAEGGKYLHEQEIVHKDLKCFNILAKTMKMLGRDMEYTHMKVADFNVAKMKKSSITYLEQTMNVGTNRWMASELIRLQSLSTEVSVGDIIAPLKYPYKCDIYSFAMVCFEILTGELPFADYSELEPIKMKIAILKGSQPRLPNECPMDLKALIEECWSVELRICPSFDEICKWLKYMKYGLMTGSLSLSKIQDPLEEEPREKALAQELILENSVELHQPIGKFEDALEDLDKADILELHNALILKSCGEAKGMMGQHADALKDLNEVGDLESHNIITLRRHGEIKRLMGKFEDALEDLDKADILEPHNALILKSRGEVKGMMGKHADALKDLNKANDLEPHNVTTLRRRGEVKRLMGKYADALKDLNKVNDLEPHNFTTLKRRGEVKRMMGMNTNALDDLYKANDLELHKVTTLRSCGEVKRMMGKYADALEDLNKAKELEPHDIFTLWSCVEVNSLMGKYASAWRT